MDEKEALFRSMAGASNGMKPSKLLPETIIDLFEASCCSSLLSVVSCQAVHDFQVLVSCNKAHAAWSGQKQLVCIQRFKHMCTHS